MLSCAVMVSLRRTTRGTVLVINPQFHDSHHQHGTNHFSNSSDFQQQLSQPNSWNYHCTHQICQHCYKGEVEPRFWCYHPQGLSIKWPKLGAHRAKTESKPWSMDVRTNLSPHLSSKQVTIYNIYLQLVSAELARVADWRRDSKGCGRN